MKSPSHLRAPLSPDEVVRLVAEAQSGSMEAFTRLVVEYKGAIEARIVEKLGHTSDREDHAQEIFLKIFRGLDHFRGESSFLTWCYTIATNHCNDVLRKRQRNPEVSLAPLPGDDDERDPLANLPDTGRPGPEDSVLAAEERLLVRQAVNDLPEIHRQILILREFEDRSYREIADLLAIPIGTVMSRLHAAREKLSLRFLELSAAGPGQGDGNG